MCCSFFHRSSIVRHQLYFEGIGRACGVGARRTGGDFRICLCLWVSGQERQGRAPSSCLSYILSAARLLLVSSCRLGCGSQGEKLPSEVKLNFFDGEGNMQEISVGELTKGKKVRGLLRHLHRCARHRWMDGWEMGGDGGR